MGRLDSNIQEIYEYQTDPKNAYDELTELEDRSRRSTSRKTERERRGMTAKKKCRICFDRDWDWMEL